ncbi:MAG: LysM domain-containing protein [Eubacteriales bacterium]|nr:LysM domain-containing protein [Eubacteriales bacterium]
MQQYVVRPNDTLFIIAREFNVPLAQLISANPHITNPNAIRPGQTIIIPDLIPIPEQLLVMETNAEEIIDDLYARDLQSVRNKIEIIKRNMRDVLPQLQQALVQENIINELNHAIRILEGYTIQERMFPAMSQANQITRYIADALDYFKTLIPSDIRRLSYLARQIIINIEQNDWGEAKNNYNRALTVWNRNKSQLNETNAEDVDYMERVFENLDISIERQEYSGTIRNAILMADAADALGSIFFERNR